MAVMFRGLPCVVRSFSQRVRSFTGQSVFCKYHFAGRYQCFVASIVQPILLCISFRNCAITVQSLFSSVFCHLEFIRQIV